MHGLFSRIILSFSLVGQSSRPFFHILNDATTLGSPLVGFVIDVRFSFLELFLCGILEEYKQKASILMKLLVLWPRHI